MRSPVSGWSFAGWSFAGEEGGVIGMERDNVVTRDPDGASPAM